jgi:tRNA(Arg) A34 adenosine deaminase TadA/ActR/RegA family two-component response regulator
MSPSKGHILIVEPNAVTRKLIAGILTARGYEIYEASNGDEGLAFLSRSPALVVIDVDGDNPSMLGLLHKMKRDHGKLAVVAVSDAEDVAALKERLGFSNLSILPKPVMPEALLANISRHFVPGVEAGIAPGPGQSAPAEDAQTRRKREEFMRRAIDLAQEKMDEGRGGPFGAVVVKNGRIVSEGWDEVIASKDPTAHAELMAIRAAAKALGEGSLAGCELYTSCEPCAMCLSAAYWAKLDRVFFACTVEDANASGFDTDYIFREMALSPGRRALPAKMMLRDESKIVFESWIKRGDKSAY